MPKHPRHLLALALLLPALAAPLPSQKAAAAADSLLTLRSHADAFKLADEAHPAKDIEVRLWLSGDRVRRDEGDTSMILRLDRNRLFLVHHPEKTYSELTLPAEFLRLLPKGQEAVGAKWAEQVRLSVKVTPGSETRKINGWNAHRVQMDVVSAMGMKIGTTLWVSRDVAGYATLNKLTAALAALQPGAAEWSQKLEALDGFPVLKEDDVNAMGTHFKTRDELVAVEPRVAPAGTFEPPAGYTAVPFNPMTNAGE